MKSSAAQGAPVKRFVGFPEGGYDFFLELQANQSRTWFLAHKEEYEHFWARPIRALGDDLVHALASAYPHVGESPPHVFRIQRDVRFSADKSPYKTHVALAMSVRPSASSSTDVEGGASVLYLHFGLDDDTVAGGRWQLGKANLERFRMAVDQPSKGARLARLLDKLQAQGFTTASHERLKRVPRPYAHNHPRADLLKLKGIAVARSDIPDGLITSPALLDWLVTQYVAVAPLINWIDAALPTA